MFHDKKNKSTKKTVILFCILLLAFLLRIFLFENRIFIFGDTARDILVARGAIENKIIPQIASFSSAGPFVFGPHYYWLLIAIYSLSTQSWDIFYYFLIIQSVFLVFIFIKIGEIIQGRKFGFLLGLIAALSPRLIIRSAIMTQHTIVVFCSTSALLFLILFLKKKKNIFAFLTGFWISLGVMMHYQAIGLLIMIASLSSIGKKIKNKLLIVMSFALGFIIPSLSFVVWDSKQNFSNFKNLLDYLLIGQKRIYIPNRWLWHIFKFWPEYTADIFGGFLPIGGLILYVSVLVVLLNLLRKKTPLAIKHIFFFFIFFYIYLRFYRGEKFEGYLMYLLPIVILLIGFGIYYFHRFKKTFFIMLIGLFFIDVFSTKSFYMSQNTNQKKELNKIVKSLEKETRAEKFAVYDFANDDGQTQTWDVSDSLVVYLGSVGKLDPEKGYKLGFCQSYCPSEKLPELKNTFFATSGKHLLLIGYSNKKFNLVKRSPKSVMEEILLWWEKRPLKSTFDLKKYIMERIPILNKK